MKTFGDERPLTNDTDRARQVLTGPSTVYNQDNVEAAAAYRHRGYGEMPSPRQADRRQRRARARR